MTEPPRALRGVLRWETPPPIQRRTPRTGDRRSWAIAAAELRRKPGHWGVIGEAAPDTNTISFRINNGHGFWKPAGAYRTITRTIDGVTVLYCAFLGDHGEYTHIAEAALTRTNPPRPA